MRAEKFVVTTAIRGKRRAEIWDPSKPLKLGYQHKWILERTDSGIQVRQPGTNICHQISPGILALPHDEMKLQVVPARHMSPPYQLPEGEVTPKGAAQDRQLLAFSGVGRGIISCIPVHTAYVAYVRSQPVFTLFHDEKGFRIKPLLDGVKFKLKKQKPIAGPVGEEWSVQAEQLYGASVIRGSHWWRFNLVAPSAQLVDGPDEEAILEQEGIGIRKMLSVFGAAFAAFAIAVWLVPRQPKVIEEMKDEAPVVKFVPPPVKPTPKAAVAEVASESEKKALEKPLPKPEAAPIKGVTEEKVKKAPEKPKAPTPPAPDPKAIAQKAAAAKLSMLRAALGGVAGMVPTTPTKNPLANKSSGVFSGGGTPLSPTEIKPTYSADKSKVSAVGEGYAKAEHASVGGQGSSFVAVDTGGPTVEEGLRKDEVGEVIHKHMDQIRYCHETAMLYKPNLSGKLVVQFGINAAGTVEKPAVQNSDLPDKTLEDCILKKLAGWKFPKPKGGVHVNVSYPFIFKTLGQD